MIKEDTSKITTIEMIAEQHVGIEGKKDKFLEKMFVGFKSKFANLKSSNMIAGKVIDGGSGKKQKLSTEAKLNLNRRNVVFQKISVNLKKLQLFIVDDYSKASCNAE